MKVYIILKFDKKDHAKVMYLCTDKVLAEQIRAGLQAKDNKHNYEIINKPLKTAKAKIKGINSTSIDVFCITNSGSVTRRFERVL